MNDLPACLTKFAFQRFLLEDPECRRRLGLEIPNYRGGLPSKTPRLPPLKRFSELPAGKTDPVPPPVGAVRLPVVATPVKPKRTLQPAPFWYMEGKCRFRDHDALRGPHSGRMLTCARSLDVALRWGSEYARAPPGCNGWTDGM